MNNISEILSVYEKIIYGELRPWIEENLDDNIFHEFLHPSVFLEKSNIEAFENELNEKIQKHPLYSSFERVKFTIDAEANTFYISNPEFEHFDELIDLSIPPSFNDKTEYYYLVLKFANDKILKSISECFTNANSKEDFSFFLNKLFAKLKLILIDTHLKEKSINYDSSLDKDMEKLDNKNQLRKVDQYVLSATRERLIQLMLEIQSFYKEYFNEVYYSDEDIYHYVLHDKHPVDDFKFKMPIFENHSVEVFFKRLHEYKLEDVKNRIERLKKCLNNIGGYITADDKINESKSLLIDNIFILENLIYFKTYINDTTELTKETLSNESLLSKWYQNHKTSIQTEISKLSSPVEIIDILVHLKENHNNLLTKIPIDKSVNIKNSLLRRQNVWLEEQINFYRANLAIDFKQIESKQTIKISTNLTVKELAFLFKMLYMEKIITTDNQTDLFKFIAANFTTKGKDDLSWKSIKNHFLTVETKTADDWVTKFTHMLQFSKENR